MFRGRYYFQLDAKGRLSIPSKFREVLSSNYDERLIITNFDACLWGYPVPEWLELENKVSRLPQFREEVKALQRVFISAAVECPIDKQGRILLPQSLREYAALELPENNERKPQSGQIKDVVVIGMTRRIEIWSRDRWQKVFESAHDRLEAMGDKLAELGL